VAGRIAYFPAATRALSGIRPKEWSCALLFSRGAHSGQYRRLAEPSACSVAASWPRQQRSEYFKQTASRLLVGPFPDDFHARMNIVCGNLCDWSVAPTIPMVAGPEDFIVDGSPPIKGRDPEIEGGVRDIRPLQRERCLPFRAPLRLVLDGRRSRGSTPEASSSRTAFAFARATWTDSRGPYGPSTMRIGFPLLSPPAAFASQRTRLPSCRDAAAKARRCVPDGDALCRVGQEVACREKYQRALACD